MLKHLTLPERYVLVRHIADGGMASVWCAEDVVLGRRVAIKLLAERFAHDEGAARRFAREARTAASLSGHRNVVTIYDVGETVGSDHNQPAQAFIVMEYLAGGTVADALRLGVVARAESVRWLQEIAAALDYAHGRGVLHRDIKPANLLLDAERVVHVTDFGIAQLATEDTLTLEGQVLGTAAYLAPERASGRATTEASDRYSLAVAAFELLTGERPFSAQRFAAQARQHIDAATPAASDRNPELPPALDAVLARGMAKQPDERWPSSGAFADAVQAALAQQLAGTPGGAPRRHRPLHAAPTAPTASPGAASPPRPTTSSRPAAPTTRRGPARRRPALSAAGAEATARAEATAGVTARPTAATTPVAAAAPAAAAARRAEPPPAVVGRRAGVGPASPPTSTPTRTRRRDPKRAIAIAALAAAAVGVGLAAGADHRSSPQRRTSPLHAQRPVAPRARRPDKPAQSHKPRANPAAAKPKPKPAAPTHSTTAPQEPPVSATAAQQEPQVSATSAAQTTPPATADTLEARGHALMENGAFGSAIPVLRQALSAASPSSLTYAYAMYDLGRSLRLAGDPRAAVPVLYKRLQIPNQTETVRLELQQALRALGEQSVGRGGGTPSHAGPSGSHGPGGSGGHQGHGRHDNGD
jgi:eukaryotic-like serine/threonine-protein kinase